MSEQQKERESRSPESPQAAEIEAKPKKKPYIKPAFRMERVFVTTALSCGKTSGNPLQQCQTNLKVS